MRPMLANRLTGGRAGQIRKRASRIRVALQSLQVRADVRGGAITQIPVLLQRLADDLFELKRDQRIQADRRDGRAIQYRVENHAGSVSGERALTGGHFIEDQSERKDVRTLIQFLAAHLFGGHVGDRTQCYAVAGEMSFLSRGAESSGFLEGEFRTFPFRHEFGETKVKELHLAAVGNENVRGLDVAVN